MVDKLTNIMSLTRNGVRDWLVQRVTSIILALYIIFLLGYLVFHPQIQFFAWQDLFQSTAFRVFSVLCLLSLIWHAWIGMWTIVTDYIKPAGIRLVVILLIIIALFAYVIWGIDILWSA